jgi:hypothetical protein
VTDILSKLLWRKRLVDGHRVASYRAEGGAMKSLKTIEPTWDKTAFVRTLSEMLREIRKIIESNQSVVVIDYSDMRSEYGPN